MPELLSMREVTVRRGLSKVIERYSISVNSGEVVLLKGENGCGKSTIIEAAAGLLTLDEGKIEHYGNLFRDSQGRTSKSHFGLSLQSQTSMCDELVSERVKAAGTNTDILSKWGLAHRSEDRFGTLSGGLKRRVDVLCGLIPAMANTEPTLILLDEPEAGLDSDSIELLARTISELAGSGHGILISTHCNELDVISNRIVKMGEEVIIKEVKHSNTFEKIESYSYSAIKHGLSLNLRTMSGFLHNGIVGLLVLGGILALTDTNELSGRLLTGLIMAPALAAGLAGDPISHLLDEGRARDWWRTSNSTPTAIPHVLLGAMLLTLICSATIDTPDWKIILSATGLATFTAIYVNWLHTICANLEKGARVGVKSLTPVILLPWAIIVDMLA